MSGPLLNNRVKVIEKNLEKGAAFSRNVGCEEAKGEYITFLDDDDTMKDGYLLQLATLIDKRRNEDEFYFCGIELYELNSDGKLQTGRIVFENNEIITEKSITDALSIGTGYGLTCRRKKLEEIGFFNEHYKYIEDTELILRLLQSNSKPFSIPECFIEVMKHNKNQLTSSANNKNRALECKKLLREKKSFFKKHNKAKAQIINHYKYLRSECEI